MKIIRSSIIYSSFTALSRIAGFIRDIVFANFLGSGASADIFYVAFRFPNTFRRIFSEGAFNSAFVPIYSKLLTKSNRTEANYFAGNTLLMLFALTLLIVIIIEIFMPTFLLLLAPGFKEDTEKFSNLIESARIIFPFLILVSVVSILSSLLNSHGKFALSAAIPIILNIVLTLAVLISFYLSSNHLLFLSWGVLLSGIIQILFLFYAIKKNKILIEFSKNYFSIPLIKFYKLFLPSILSSGILQINILIGTIIASFESGAVSYLYYADRIYQLPLALIGIAIGITMLPNISKKIKMSTKKDVNNTIEKTIIYSLLLAIPASMALYIIPEIIIKILFERGAFNETSTYYSSIALKLFSIGLVAFILTKILTPIYFANENPKPPMNFALITVIINVSLSIYLFQIIGFLGIAAATSIASWCNVVLLYIDLKNKDYFFHTKEILKPLLVIIFSSSIMIIYLSYIKSIFMKAEFLYFYHEILLFILMIVSSAVVYFLIISFYKPFTYARLKENLLSNE